MDALSTATDTGAATTGPATFSDSSLSWTEDSSASTPAQESTPAASASADAIDPPAEQSPPDGTTPTAGAPPPERWDTILANARAKAAEEAIAPLAWAKDVAPQEFQQIQTLARNLYGGGDPVAGLQTLIAEMRKNPAIEAQIRSFAARTLATRSPAPTNQEPQPDLPIQLEDGRVVHLYSADQQAKREAFLQQKWMQSVQQELQPLKQTHETLQAERAAIQETHEWNTWQSQQVSDTLTWPGMDNPDVRAQFAKEVERNIMGRDIKRDQIEREIDKAYRKVVVPSLSRQAQSTLLDNLKQKAAASTSVNPGSAAASSPRAVTRFSDLPPEAWK